MPFTFAHPAIILPFAKLEKGWVSITGLIIGSIVPDFEYFLRMDVKSYHGHTLGGLFYFDFPLAILLCFVFHNLIRNSLIKNLPFRLQQRFITFTYFEWNHFFLRNWNLVVVSIFIGVGSHFLLDSFTNREGLFVNLIPFLQSRFVYNGQSIIFFQVLYYILSIVGLIIISYGIRQMPLHRRFRPTRPSILYWAIMGLVTIASCILFTSLRFDEYMRSLYKHLLGYLLIIAISSFLIGLLVASFIFLNKGKNRR